MGGWTLRWKRVGLASLVVVLSAILGATVLREPIAVAASPFTNVIVGNTTANPVPVAQQGTADVKVTNSTLSVQQQGTADVRVTNASVPVQQQGTAGVRVDERQPYRRAAGPHHGRRLRHRRQRGGFDRRRRQHGDGDLAGRWGSASPPPPKSSGGARTSRSSTVPPSAASAPSCSAFPLTDPDRQAGLQRLVRHMPSAWLGRRRLVIALACTGLRRPVHATLEREGWNSTDTTTGAVASWGHPSSLAARHRTNGSRV